MKRTPLYLVSITTLGLILVANSVTALGSTAPGPPTPAPTATPAVGGAPNGGGGPPQGDSFPWVWHWSPGCWRVLAPSGWAVAFEGSTAARSTLGERRSG